METGSPTRSLPQPRPPRRSDGTADVMLVEDDRTVLGVVGDYLRALGYRVTQFADGRAASVALRASTPNLLILDRMLPGLSGDDVLRDLRSYSDIPVVMLTALDSTGARIDGLERGADDYLTKPFSLRELQLRVESLLRRRSQVEAAWAPFSVGSFRIDPAMRRISRDGREILLTAREYELFAFLLKNPDRVLSREEILRDVWGWDFGDASTVTVHVRRLREKIEPDPTEPRHLLTVWGAGYQFSVGRGR
jgi:Response regulators consisting of a CheY-like receiver domain and a winged-helix DNA-binding domain